MARRELQPSSLQVAQAVAAVMPAGRVAVGVSGGADSMALAMGAAWAAPRAGAQVECVVIDHGLQTGSAEVALGVVEQLRGRGLAASRVPVAVTDTGQGMEADARDARLAALQSLGVPVLLGHTLDDQAEQVLLGLLRGSGTRSLAGIPPRRGPFLRPLLGVRRQVTEDACRQWDLEIWQDPHNEDPSFARVRVRALLARLSRELGRDLVPMLGRSAELARIDADFLDGMALPHVPAGPNLGIAEVTDLPDAIRLRVVKEWLARGGVPAEMAHVVAVDALVRRWRGQGPVHVPGAVVARHDDALVVLPRQEPPAAAE